ncbi:MAG TPA: ABC transporter permease, partial [bacterium]|nr:ABC transporter permease [bacterium]
LLGTDDLGRDLYARMLYGGRVSLSIAMSTGIGAGLAGTAIGLTAGYFRRIDIPLMLLMDGLMAFPAILLALAIVAALGPGYLNVSLALALVYTPRIARVARGSVLVVREMDYVETARAIGARSGRILWRYLLPNILAPVLVQTTLLLAFALLAEASLSFLGVGGPGESISWGGIIAEGRLDLDVAPWLMLYPGIAIAVTVLAVNILGDALRDTLDPRLRGM